MPLGGNSVLSQYASSESEYSIIAEDSANLHHRVPFPRNMKKEFMQMRTNFGTTFYNVRDIFSKKAKSPKVVSKMKSLLTDIFPDLKSELSVAKKIDGVLDVVKRKCNIVDVHPLEVLAVQFKVKEAEDVIREHEEAAKEFCKSVSVSLSKDKTLQAIPTRHLLCETMTFVLNWNPDETTLQDVNDVLIDLDLLHKYGIKVVKVDPGKSVVVTCYCPAEYTGSLIMALFGEIDTMQKKGLKEFMVGNCTVWNATQVRYSYNDSNLLLFLIVYMQVVSENTKVTDLLVQINDLKTALRDRDERIMSKRYLCIDPLILYT